VFAAGVLRDGVGRAATSAARCCLSHGLLLIFSAPIWLIAGLTGTITLAVGNDRETKDPEQFKALSQYARFPQGMVKRLARCPDHPGAAEPAVVPSGGVLQL